MTSPLTTGAAGASNEAVRLVDAFEGASGRWGQNFEKVRSELLAYIAGVEWERDRLRAELDAARKAERAAAWQPIATAPYNKIVLVYYRNVLGNSRILRACYYGENELENDGSQEEEYASAGWYESPAEAEHCERLSEPPTHWMPLPKPPIAALAFTPQGDKNV